METHDMASLAQTFKFLADTDNDAASPLLLAALDASQRDIRDYALSAVLDRGNQGAELTILRRWPTLSDRWKQQIADRPLWLSNAIRAVVVNRDQGLFESACSAATFTRDYEAIPLLVSVAIDGPKSLITQAATAVLELTELLADEIYSPRDYRIRRDPRLIRDHVLVGLEKIIEHLDRPNARELLEAFLLLANRDTASLKRLLQSPNSSGYDLLTEVLVSSSRPGVERLLLSYLDDAHAPYAATEIMGCRTNISFLRQFTRKLAAGPSPIEKANLARINSIAWLPRKMNLLDTLREAEQTGAIYLAIHSSIPRDEAFDVIAYILRYGTVAARRLAAQVLSGFAGKEANRLVLQLLDDDDVHVRVAAAGQLRSRDLPGAVQRLADLLDSSHPLEREVAQNNLKEFNFEHFAAIFDHLTAEARLTSGALVRRIDPAAINRIQLELAAESRGRKMRALELAVALGAIEELRVPIANLLHDEDQYLRIETVRAVATHDSRGTRDILRSALLDSHPLVQQAAESALAQLNRKTETQVVDADRETVLLPLAGNKSPPAALPAVPAASPPTPVGVTP
jgi:HEAT repeat protein